MNLFKDAWSFWVETWNTNKILFFAEFFGSILGMGASSIMAFQSPNPNVLSAFILYWISGILLMYACYVRRSSWMLLLMMFYVVTTGIGISKFF